MHHKVRVVPGKKKRREIEERHSALAWYSGEFITLPHLLRACSLVPLYLRVFCSFLTAFSQLSHSFYTDFDAFQSTMAHMAMQRVAKEVRECAVANDITEAGIHIEVVDNNILHIKVSLFFKNVFPKNGSAKSPCLGLTCQLENRYCAPGAVAACIMCALRRIRKKGSCQEEENTRTLSRRRENGESGPWAA